MFFPHFWWSVIHIHFGEWMQWTSCCLINHCAVQCTFFKQICALTPGSNNITGRYDVYRHASATSSKCQASVKHFSSHSEVNENQWLSGRLEKKHIKHLLTHQQRCDVWVEANELKHVETLKRSYRNTLRKHFTCKNVQFHNMHTHTSYTHTHIYIVCSP